MKRKMVILSLACLMALSGATGVHAEENLPVDESGAVNPLGKYEDPVTVEIVQSINPTITMPEGELPGPPARIATCCVCGEDVLDCKEVMQDGKTYCRACLNGAYYSPIGGSHA